jgi:hypothetical protein
MFGLKRGGALKELSGQVARSVTQSPILVSSGTEHGSKEAGRFISPSLCLVYDSIAVSV